MLRISQLKMKPNHTKEDLENQICQILRIKRNQLVHYEIAKRSIDARYKPDIYYVYTIDLSCGNENQVLKSCRKKNVAKTDHKVYRFPSCGTAPLMYPPVIIGMGPAGLFCGLMLARAGYRPIILERGEEISKRTDTVARFWESGELNPSSNVQFGEGGAGTFSDGKLNTGIKDPDGKGKFVLRTFVEAGADPVILYDAKPHIGTDVLRTVITNIRNEIISLGGTVLFEHQLMRFTESEETGQTVYDLEIQKTDLSKEDPASYIYLKTSLVIMAIGHSARDTFEYLQKKKIPMHPKAFAVGVRVEHPQKLINDDLYGKDCPYELPPAPYKVTHKLPDGNGVYSFCMCPGGYVVNASSEMGRTAVNGMSYHDRSGQNANSAIVVTVSPEDYGCEHELSGLDFQRKLEEEAYRCGEGKVPLQRLEDFIENQPSNHLGSILPQIRGEYHLTNLRSIFPDRISQSIIEGIRSFDRQISGFSHPDVLLSAVESRTSSPVRIERDSDYQIPGFPGIYPCGEGAGYAGGITSAAMDGIRIAEQIASKFSIDFL